MYFREFWTDYRLEFRNLEQARNINGTIVLGAEMTEVIWTPDPFFPQTKKGELHKLPTPNILFHLSPDGSIFLSQRFVFEFLRSVFKDSCFSALLSSLKNTFNFERTVQYERANT